MESCYEESFGVSCIKSLTFAEAAIEVQQDSCSSDGCTQTCEPGWEEFDGRGYIWSKEKMFWGAAEEECRNMGGHLASVTSQDVHKFLHQSVRGSTRINLITLSD